MKACMLLLVWAATLAAQAPVHLSVDGDYVEGPCSQGSQCVSIRACFNADFADEVKLSHLTTFVLTLPSRVFSPTDVSPVGGVNPCVPKMFRLLAAGEAPEAGALRLRVRTRRTFAEDVILILRYVSCAHTVFLEPDWEG
jgi:hypothetical protein